jgi:RHS repeat-associated protein
MRFGFTKLMAKMKFEYRNMAEADNELVWSSQQSNTQGLITSSVYAGNTYEMPSPFGSGTDANMSFSIYATYTPDDQQNVVTLLGNPFMYTGQAYENETGLYYYHARFYSPILGRFLQTDPVGYEAGMNLYGYCRNNSLNCTDPSGCRSITFDPCSSSFWDFLDTTGARLGLTSGLLDAMYRHWRNGHKVIIFENGDDLNNTDIAWDDDDAYFMLSDCNFYSYHVKSSFWVGDREGLDYGNLSWLDWAVHLGQAALSGLNDGFNIAWCHDSSTIAQYGTLGTICNYVGAASQGVMAGYILGAVLCSLPTMTIAAGTTASFPSLHFAYATEGTSLHAYMSNNLPFAVRQAGAAEFISQDWNINLPILYPDAVLATEGTVPTNCFTAMIYALYVGWGGPPF